MLAILCACGALVRTLSMSLDAMTGGLARIMILGKCVLVRVYISVCLRARAKESG